MHNVLAGGVRRRVPARRAAERLPSNWRAGNVLRAATPHLISLIDVHSGALPWPAVCSAGVIRSGWLHQREQCGVSTQVPV